MSENGKNVNSTLKNVVVTRLVSAEETFVDGAASLNSANGATDTGSTSPVRIHSRHSETKKVEISTELEDTTINQYQHLHPSFHQTLIDFGKQHGFWPWLTRFGELFGYKQLLQFMITVNSIEHDLEALVISQAANQEDAYLRLIRQLFDVTVIDINIVPEKITDRNLQFVLRCGCFDKEIKEYSRFDRSWSEC